MAMAPGVQFPVVTVIRVIGVAVAALVLTWALHFRGGMSLISDNKDLIFNLTIFFELSIDRLCTLKDKSMLFIINHGHVIICSATSRKTSVARMAYSKTRLTAGDMMAPICVQFGCISPPKLQ